MLIFSPLNMASMRPQAGFLRQLEQQFEGLVGDAVLRIIQKESRRIGGHEHE
jgi:hypothetical protein